MKFDTFPLLVQQLKRKLFQQMEEKTTFAHYAKVKPIQITLLYEI